MFHHINTTTTTKKENEFQDEETSTTTKKTKILFSFLCWCVALLSERPGSYLVCSLPNLFKYTPVDFEKKTERSCHVTNFDFPSGRLKMEVM
jgi:hypothetical protein